MQWQAIRNLSKNGNSYTIALPRQFLMKLALFRGEPMKVIYDDDTETIIITRAEPRPAGLNVISGHRGIRPVFR